MIENIRPEFIVDENQMRKSVVLRIEDWQKIREELEALEDIRAFDEAKAGPQDRVP